MNLQDMIDTSAPLRISQRERDRMERLVEIMIHMIAKDDGMIAMIPAEYLPIVAHCIAVGIDAGTVTE